MENEKVECLETTLLPDEPKDIESQATTNSNGPDVERFNGVEISKLTKRQMKKYKKYLEWQKMKKLKRIEEKEKQKLKRKNAKLLNIDTGPSRKQLKRMIMEKPASKVTVCIDLSFDDLMIDKDIAKTVKQISRIYAENRRSKAPLQLHLSNFNGKIKTAMEKHDGYQNWNITFNDKHYLEIFPKNQLVYLSSDSNNILDKLEENKVYIIGGLVDHNSHKGLCHQKAETEGISHAQLPIGEYFKLKQGKVLTINQVFEILIKISEGETVENAIHLILPKRKLASCLSQNNIIENKEEK